MFFTNFSRVSFFIVSAFCFLGCGGGGAGVSGGSSGGSSSSSSGSENIFTLSGQSTVEVAENTTDFGTGLSISGSFSGSIQYTLVETADSSLFSINPDSGEIVFLVPPDYEAPNDSNSDNSYELIIRATADTGGSSQFATTVVVYNVEEYPALVNDPNFVVGEGEQTVDSLIITPGDGNVSVWLAGNDRFLFSLSDDYRLYFDTAPDYEAFDDADGNNQYELTLQLYDDGELEAEIDLTVVVTDELEPIVVPAIEPVAIEGRVSTGVRMIAASSVDSVVTIELAASHDKDRFLVNPETNMLEFVEAPHLSAPNDHNQDGIYEITLMAQTSEGNTWEKDYLITIKPATTMKIDIRMPALIESVIQVPRKKTFTLSGYLLDINSNPVSSSELLHFTAGEQPVNYDDSTGFWQATVPLSIGESSVHIIAEDVNGGLVAQDLHFSNRSPFELREGSGMALDYENNRIFFVSGSTGGPLAYDLNTLMPIPNFAPPNLSIRNVWDYAIDVSGQVLFAITRKDIWHIDLADYSWTLLKSFSETDDAALSKLVSVARDSSTGTLYLLSDESEQGVSLHSFDPITTETTLLHNNGESLTLLRSSKLEFDDGNRRLLLTDRVEEAVVAVNITSGERTLVSTHDSSVSNPPKLNFPEGLVIDEANDTVWIAETELGGSRLFSMDLSSGVLRDHLIPGPEIFALTDLVLDQKNNRLLASDARRDMLWAIDPVMGTRETILGNSVGEGPYLWKPSALAIDTLNKKSYIARDHEIIEVNLLTGDRRVISGYSEYDFNTFGNGLGLGFVEGIVVDATNKRLFVADIYHDAIKVIDLTNGDRSLLSSTSRARPTVGEGPLIPAVVDLYYQASSDTLYALDITADALLTIDTSNGYRTVISNSETGIGPDFEGPMAMEVDEENGIAYVFDSTLERLLTVDLITGERALLELSGSFPVLADVFYEYFDHVDLELDLKNQKLYIGFTASGRYFEIDLQSNELLEIGTFASFRYPIGFEVDFERDLAYQIDYHEQKLKIIDMKTGERMSISQ